MKKLIYVVFIFHFSINVWSADTYNSSINQLTIPMVRVGTTNYTNVVITVEEVVSVGTNSTPYAVDFYKPDSNQLIIPVVNVGGNTYNNVVITVGNVISSEGQAPQGSPSSIVQASSYLNAKNIGIGPQFIPMITIPKIPNQPELIQSAFAFGDFFQDGTLALVAGSGYFGGDNGYTSTTAGKLYFFHSDDKGGWVDQTSKLLTDQTGCITARKVLVADFNGDGKPDSFIACHGIDGTLPPGYTYGEHSRYLMSQPDGTYKNIDTGINGYFHSASAVELNKKGFADIAVVDPQVQSQPYFLINNGDGTFTQDFNRMPAGTLPYYFPGSTTPHGMSIYETELIDFNGDGKYDLFLGGNEIGPNNCTQWVFCIFPSNVYLNDGSNNFKNINPITLPSDTSYAFALDITYASNNIYLLRVDINPPNSIYGNSEIQKISWPKINQSIIYQTPSIYALPNTYPNGTIQYPSTWVDWIEPYNGNIVSTNSVYGVSVPQ